MNTLAGFPIHTHYQNLLANRSEEDALVVLHEFFQCYDNDSAKEVLWFMLAQALKHDSETVTALHRSNMIFFYECCLVLFKAAQVLNNEYEHKPVINVSE